MNIKQILETSDSRSIGMYFHGSHIYHGNDVVLVAGTSENGLHLRRVRDRHNFSVCLEDSPEEVERLRFINIPNFYYIEEEVPARDYQFKKVYVYKSPRRTTVKGLNSERLVSNNPYYNIQKAMKAIDAGEVFFSDKTANDELMWFKGNIVGERGVLFPEQEWLDR